MCRVCSRLLPRLTDRYLFWRSTVAQLVLVAGLLYLASGWVLAQSQDYINAQHAEQIAALTQRVERMETGLDRALWGIAAVLFTQILTIRSNKKAS